MFLVSGSLLIGSLSVKANRETWVYRDLMNKFLLDILNKESLMKLAMGTRTNEVLTGRWKTITHDRPNRSHYPFDLFGSDAFKSLLIDEELVIVSRPATVLAPDN